MPVHHLMVGTWTPPGVIFTFAFDDEARTLELVKRTEIPEDEPISWMTLSHDKKTLYGAAMKKWASFDVSSPTSIVHQASVPMLHHPLAASSSTNTRAIFLLAAKQPPYAVYCAPFYKHADHATVLSALPSGALSPSPLQHTPLQDNSGIHGFAFDPTETYLYGADLPANLLWTHRKDEDGSLTLVGAVPAPAPDDRPRWVAVHPSGRFLYAVMEHSNRLCEFRISPDTHLPEFTSASYPLVPPSVLKPGLFRADVCALSHSGKHLFASSRSNSFDVPGYVTSFRLDEEGRIETQLFLEETRTSGGHSNAVAPSDWCDEWLALTDDQEGWLEVLRWEGEELTSVAKVRVPEPGFGMNAVWYD